MQDDTSLIHQAPAFLAIPTTNELLWSLVPTRGACGIAKDSLSSLDYVRYTGKMYQSPLQRPCYISRSCINVCVCVYLSLYYTYIHICMCMGYHLHIYIYGKSGSNNHSGSHIACWPLVLRTQPWTCLLVGRRNRACPEICCWVFPNSLGPHVFQHRSPDYHSYDSAVINVIALVLLVS